MNEFILKRKKDELKYDLKPLDKFNLKNEEAKRAILFKFIKKILFSSNNSFYLDFKKDIINILKESLFKNSIFFVCITLVNFITNYFWKDSKIIKNYFIINDYNNSIKFILYRFIFIIFPELFAIFVFKGIKFYFNNKDVIKIMNRFNKRYQNNFNNIPGNNIICKEVNNDFDLHFIIKKKNKNNENCKALYNTSTSILNQNIFYEYAIIYSTNSLYKLYYHSLSIEEKIKILKIALSLSAKQMSFEKEYKKNLKYTFFFYSIKHYLDISALESISLLLFLIKVILAIFEFFMDLIFIDYKWQLNLEKFKKDKNEEININGDGYFFDINNNIVILYKLKKNFISLKYDYQYFCRESRKLMNS